MVLAFSVVIILVFSGFYTEAIVQTGYTITTANVITKVAPISISSLPLASNTILYAVIILFSIVSAVIGGTGLLLHRIHEEGEQEEEEGKEGG